MFREMFEMSDREVEICMSILICGSVILNIRRDVEQNAIDVDFALHGDLEKKTYRISLLPDSIDELSDDVQLKHGGLYLYEQFMIAKGYSEYWMDNIFV